MGTRAWLSEQFSFLCFCCCLISLPCHHSFRYSLLRSIHENNVTKCILNVVCVQCIIYGCNRSVFIFGGYSKRRFLFGYLRGSLLTSRFYIENIYVEASENRGSLIEFENYHNRRIGILNISLIWCS